MIFISSLSLSRFHLLIILAFFISHWNSIDAAIPEKNLEHSLASLERQVQKELQMLNIPADPWMQYATDTCPLEILDVAIIGGGMGGLTTSFALLNEGVGNIKVFDENASGCEGPWSRYARMNVLRSSKTDLGPSLGVPSLTFWAWYEVQFGPESWEQLKLVPTKMWNDYLCWFKHILHLPVENNIALTKIIPLKNIFELTFEKNGVEQIVYARKVVLATGRDGAGGFKVPDFMKDFPSHLYAHTAQPIAIESFADKTFAIIGGGASAFDMAATALEHGAKAVHMLIRREALPTVNKFGRIAHAGAALGFYYLKDEQRWTYVAEGMEGGIPLPKETLERVKHYSNLYMHYSTRIQKIDSHHTSATIFTDHGDISVDFIVAATGFEVNLSLRPELENINKEILLWESCASSELVANNVKLGRFPYLGPHFEFLEVHHGDAPYLKNIYCFNYGAFLSHGFLGSDISLNTLGAKRLAEGIVIDLFLTRLNPQ